MEKKIMYGDVACNEMKSKNWKKMHGIPLKTNGITEFGGVVIKLKKGYISKRSKKKRKKYHFRGTLNLIVESTLANKPDEKRIYHRYGYMKKTYKKKIHALNRRTVR